MKNYFEKTMDEEQGRKFQVQYRESGLRTRQKKFKNPMILATALANQDI
jgi:hypothetical protein